jgi:two-component system, NtrC family, sensor kinase
MVSRARKTECLRMHKKLSGDNSVLERKNQNMSQEQQAQMCDCLLMAERLKTISTLTPGFAHDAGTPLMAISSLSQILREKSSDPFFQEKLGQIGQSVDRISQIVRILVDFSRPIRPERGKVYLNSVIVEAVRIIKYDRRLKYRAVTTELVAQIPQVEASADQLLQVFISLCLNSAEALEAMPEGTLVLKTWHQEGWVCASVTDSGIGISAENIRDIFSPFFNASSEGTGSGLALSVSRAIIEAHGGKIDVESEPGKGTSVVIALPACAAEMGA